MTRVKTVAFLCVLVAGLATVARAETPTARERAIAAVEKLGGTMEVDETRPGRPVVGVDLSRSAVTDADLVLLAALPDLEVLDLRLTSVGDAGVAHLRGAKVLRFLNLFRTRLTDPGLDHLTGSSSGSRAFSSPRGASSTSWRRPRAGRSPAGSTPSRPKAAPRALSVRLASRRRLPRSASALLSYPFWAEFAR